MSVAARAVAVGLDLGSTVIKAGVLDSTGRMRVAAAAPAPELIGHGVVRECDAEVYLDVARAVLRDARYGLAASVPLGIAAQRSSFLLWNRDDGTARTPLISWQDRRAAGWCARHAALDAEVRRRTGLVLSAHYAGPKLARLLEERADLAEDARAGRVLFGNLETRLLWSTGRGRPHETDATMAARTAMFDLGTGAWSSELLARYGVPLEALPSIAPTAGRSIALDLGLTVTATLSDQAAGVLAVLEDGADDVLITLGTGGFVLRPAAPSERAPGYLTAPVLGAARGIERAVLEGTVNGAGAALDRFPPRPASLPERDPAPDAFCIPDVAGLGSPFWRPEIGLTFSAAAERLDAAGRRRVVLEGLLFRLQQVLDDLCPGRPPRRVILSGGVTAEPALAPGFATLLGRPLEVLVEPEAGLLGAARLAAGLVPFAAPATRVVQADSTGAYLAGKHAAWQTWLSGQL